MTEDEWEEFYDALSERLRGDYPELYESLFSPNKTGKGILDAAELMPCQTMAWERGLFPRRAREAGRRDAARPARSAWSVQRQLGPSAVMYANHFPNSDPKLERFFQEFGTELVLGLKEPAQ